jgi:hypothetical protein
LASASFTALRSANSSSQSRFTDSSSEPDVIEWEGRSRDRDCYGEIEKSLVAYAIFVEIVNLTDCRVVGAVVLPPFGGPLLGLGHDRRDNLLPDLRWRRLQDVFPSTPPRSLRPSRSLVTKVFLSLCGLVSNELGCRRSSPRQSLCARNSHRVGEPIDEHPKIIAGDDDYRVFVRPIRLPQHHIAASFRLMVILPCAGTRERQSRR